MRLKLTIAYVGTHFKGWQVQEHPHYPRPRTVQAELEAAIGRIAGEQLLKLETLGLTPAEAEEKILEGFLR